MKAKLRALVLVFCIVVPTSGCETVGQVAGGLALGVVLENTFRGGAAATVKWFKDTYRSLTEPGEASPPPSSSKFPADLV